jgi:uncharacterized membrane protein
MTTKLTLSIDDSIIKSAKQFAKKNHTSLSKMAQNYFASLIEPTKTNTLSSRISDLKGSLKTSHVVNDKTSLSRALKKKYL